MIRIPDGLFYYHGEKPPPLPCQYVDQAGDLITSISGATLTAKISVDEATESDVTCTNNDDGTFTIDWDTVTSDFALATGINLGSMRVDIEVDQGGGIVWYMPRFSIPIKRRT